MRPPAGWPSTPGRNRTCDLRFRKPSLYPLSYEGKCFDNPRLRPAAKYRSIGLTPVLTPAYISAVPTARRRGPWFEPGGLNAGAGVGRLGRFVFELGETLGVPPHRPWPQINLARDKKEF